MFRKMMIIVMALFLTSTSVWAFEVGGVTFSDTKKIVDTDLVLNGAGIRKKFAMKVYGVGLYLKAKSTDAKAILDADEVMGLEMRWRWAVPPQKIDEVFYESFAEASGTPKASSYGPQTDFGPLSKKIVTFMNYINQRETTKEDAWIFNYIPGKGTEVYVHDGTKNELMGVIPGFEFKKTLFTIWLGEDPAVGNSLKDALLGK
jgi:hypothetical protein